MYNCVYSNKIAIIVVHHIDLIETTELNNCSVLEFAHDVESFIKTRNSDFHANRNFGTYTFHKSQNCFPPFRWILHSLPVTPSNIVFSDNSVPYRVTLFSTMRREQIGVLQIKIETKNYVSPSNKIVQPRYTHLHIIKHIIIIAVHKL